MTWAQCRGFSTVPILPTFRTPLSIVNDAGAGLFMKFYPIADMMHSALAGRASANDALWGIILVGRTPLWNNASVLLVRSQDMAPVMKPATGYTNRPVSEDPRDVEAWGLTEAARRLIHARQSPENPELLRQALSLNQRLWTIFQTSMVDPECPLPRDVRDNILTLSIIVDRQTFDRLIDLDVAKLDRLIDINRAVATGLSQRPAAGDAAAAVQQQAPVPPPMPKPTNPPLPTGKLSISI